MAKKKKQAIFIGVNKGCLLETVFFFCWGYMVYELNFESWKKFEQLDVSQSYVQKQTLSSRVPLLCALW